MKIKPIFIAMIFSLLAFSTFSQATDSLHAKPDSGSQITPQQYGAKGDGKADDTAAIRAADAAAKEGAGVTYLPGTYRINSDVTLSAPVIMMPGATFAHGGSSLTFNGLFDAGDFQVFTGTGLVSWGPGQATVKGVWFGMSPDNTDAGNSAAFTSMMNSLGGYVDVYGGKTYRTVITPTGNIPIKTITFNAPSHTNWINNSCFLSSSISNPGSSAITIGGDAKYDRRNYRIYGLRVKGPSSTWAAAWASGRVGVDIRNVEESEIHIDQSSFFNTGLQLTGDGGSVGYNKIYLDGELVENLYGINFFLTPANKKSGWVNENNFYGGRIAVHDEGRNPAGLGITPVGINIPYPDTTYHIPNNNRFWGPSIEGTSTTMEGKTYTTLAFSISGCSNVLYQPRSEGTMGGVFTGNSIFNAAVLPQSVNYADGVIGNLLSWTNGNYDKFTSSGSFISSAIKSTEPKTQTATSNSISTTVGSTCQMFVTLNLTSGQAPTLTGSDGHFPPTTLSNGLNLITWTASADTNTLTLTNTANANFSIRSVGPGPAGVYDTTGTNQVTSFFGMKFGTPYADNRYTDILALKNTYGVGGTRTMGLYDTLGAGVIGFGNGTLALRDKIIFGNTGAGGTPANSAPTSSTGANVGIYYGTGSPNSVITALAGSIYLRKDGGPATTIYFKESGSGNTGWVPYAAAPITGSGAPSANAAFPGQIYIDTTGHNAYISINTGTGASDWHKL